MKKNNPLVLKVFLGFAIMIGLGITSTNYASANNHTDTRFARYSTGDGGDSVTSPRSKTDLTSMYAYNDQSTLYVYLRPVGSYGGSTFYTNQVASGYTYLGVGSAKYISNYVRETVDANGKSKPSYSHAAFLISPGSHSKTWISFLWSPDSV